MGAHDLIQSEYVAQAERQAETEKLIESLRHRLESVERQREHLEAENRRLALDLYRATARLATP